MTIIHIKEGEFEKEVEQAPLPVCIDFWADWCEPCRMLSPVMDELATAYCGRMKFVKINIDEAPQIAVEHRIMSIPTVSVFVGGKEVKRLIGLRDKAELKQELDSILLK
ncbi:MAG: thioredoxin [Eubacteriales bacterium]|nr:thioredoxin [Eubacteriales bacterium]